MCNISMHDNVQYLIGGGFWYYMYKFKSVNNLATVILGPNNKYIIPTNISGSKADYVQEEAYFLSYLSHQGTPLICTANSFLSPIK